MKNEKKVSEKKAVVEEQKVEKVKPVAAKKADVKVEEKSEDEKIYEFEVALKRYQAKGEKKLYPFMILAIGGCVLLTLGIVFLILGPVLAAQPQYSSAEQERLVLIFVPLGMFFLFGGIGMGSAGTALWIVRGISNKNVKNKIEKITYDLEKLKRFHK